jgi:sugar lactone lactonase YvrE
MKKYTFIIVVLSGILNPIFSIAQIGVITTVAGDHIAGFGGDGGPATGARFNYPEGIAFDASGNMYVTDYVNHRIRKISPSGIISTFAGTGSPGYSGDGGPATLAHLFYPVGITVDASGNIYFADASNNRIRKINTSGIISTVAGNGSTSFSGDGGPATAAALYWPSAVALDAGGNIYITDFSNNRVRKVSTSGIISTFAGTGTAGYSGDGGAATLAQLSLPYGVNVNSSGDIYISDYGNHVVRKIAPSSIITTFAGTGTPGFSGDGGPATAAQFNLPQGVVFDALGNSYIVDMKNHRVRKISTSGIISTVAGNGIAGYSGDGGIATLAQLDSPCALAVDINASLYVCEFGNQVVRKIQFAADHISDSFSVDINDYCSGPQIIVIPNHYSSGMSVKTLYGDGSNDLTAISGGGYAIISHNYVNSGTYTIKNILFSGMVAIDSTSYTCTHTICNSFTIKFYYDGNANCIKDGTEGYNSQPLTIEIDSAGVAIDTICATSGLYYTAYGPVGTVYGFKSLSTPTGMHISCPSTGIIYDTISATSYSPPAKYVALSCITSTAFDLSVSAVIPVTGVNDEWGNIYIQNAYCMPENGTVTLHYSSKYAGTPNQINPPATSVSGSTIVWNLSALSSSTPTPANLHYSIWKGTTPLTVGDTVHSYVTVESGRVVILTKCG